MRLYFIGMPGCGKSRLARELSNKSGINYADLDSDIVKVAKMSIEEIFETKGEDYFRELESKVLASYQNEKNLIISCGGGVIKNPNNKKLMKGITLFLDTPLDIIEERLKNSANVRPLLKTKRVIDLYNERIDSYLRFADYRIIHTDYESTLVKIDSILHSKKKKILIINGPNLNMLGKRDKTQYGSMTLLDINNLIMEEKYFQYDFFQSNHEGEIIDKIQRAGIYDGLIINAGGYTHTSVAIHDALEILTIPKVEVHLSDPDTREEFRHINLIRSVCNYTVKGLKEQSYIEAVRYLKNTINVL